MGIFDRLLGKKSPEQAMADKIGKAGDNKIYVYEANNPDNPNGWALATKEQAMAALKNDPSSVAIVQGYSKFRKGEKHIPGVPSTRGGYKIDYIALTGK